MKWKTRAIITCFILGITIVGVTMAFYSNKGVGLENVMTTEKSSVYLQEIFDPTDVWLSGELKEKRVNFGNQGGKDQVIRFCVETQWLGEYEETWEPTSINPVEIKWTSALEQEWTTFPGDNWYYYKKVLSAGEETAEVMTGVLFSSKLSNDVAIEDFTHKTYKIVVRMEGLDVNKTITSVKWGKTFQESDGLSWSVSN